MLGGTYVLLDVNEKQPVTRLVHKLLFGFLPDDLFVLVCKRSFMRPVCATCKTQSFQKIMPTRRRILLKKSKKQPAGVSMAEFYSYGLSFLFHR